MNMIHHRHPSTKQHKGITPSPPQIPYITRALQDSEIHMDLAFLFFSFLSFFFFFFFSQKVHMDFPYHFCAENREAKKAKYPMVIILVFLW